MSPAAPSPEAGAFEQAERTSPAGYGVRAESRYVRLADPPLTVRVLESGTGDPLHPRVVRVRRVA